MKVSVIDFGAVPKGTYVIGDIRLRSKFTLHLLEDAVLLGSLDPKDYRNILEDAIEPLPQEQRADIAWMLPGPWQEHGGGFKEYLYCAGSYWNYGMIRGPHGINMHFCRNVTFKGYTITNTGNWAHAIF